jgi:hypothetical protein
MTRRLTRPGTEIDNLLWVIPYRCVNQLSISQFQNHGVLHVLPVLLDIIIGNRVSPVTIVVVPAERPKSAHAGLCCVTCPISHCMIGSPAIDNQRWRIH